jgi:hypothetical protein
MLLMNACSRIVTNMAFKFIDRLRMDISCQRHDGLDVNLSNKFDSAQRSTFSNESNSHVSARIFTSKIKLVRELLV